jgi:hypothetical protein
MQWRHKRKKKWRAAKLRCCIFEVFVFFWELPMPFEKEAWRGGGKNVA